MARRVIGMFPLQQHLCGGDERDFIELIRKRDPDYLEPRGLFFVFTAC
jgi:hypothetical protein